MDITSYRSSDGSSLIEIGFLSAPIAWLNESVAPNLTEQEMMDWCNRYYKTQKLTEEEKQSIYRRSLIHKKLIPQNFLFELNLACEILYKVIEFSQQNVTE